MSLPARWVAICFFSAICLPSFGTEEIWKYIHGQTDELPDSVLKQTWEEVYAVLKERAWEPAEKPGEILSHTHRLANGHEPTFFYYVPKTYEPSTPTPVVIYLHGGVASPELKRGRLGIDNWKSWADETGGIVIAPSSSADNMWWEPPGEAHVLEALRYVSERYHLDRNRIAVSGFSDGGTGTYSLGMRYTDVWAACIPWNGALRVITNRRVASAIFFTRNCANTSWRAVHGELDQLYPGADQEEPIRRLKEAGAEVTWDIFDGVAHNRAGTIERDREFVTGWLAEQKRDPLPEKVDLTVNEPKRYGRSFWIRVKSLTHWEHNPFSDEELSWPVEGADSKRPLFGFMPDEEFEGEGVKVRRVALFSGAKEAGLQKGDVIQSIGGSNVTRFSDIGPMLKRVASGEFVDVIVDRGGREMALTIPYRPLTMPPRPVLENAGRIEAKRNGNTIWTRSKRVGAFDILISPKAFDLSKEIVVKFKGTERFRGMVEPDTKVMLDEMRARQGDASVPFVARIPVVVDPKSVE